jgi:hypothetical protein
LSVRCRAPESSFSYGFAVLHLKVDAMSRNKKLS